MSTSLANSLGPPFLEPLGHQVPIYCGFTHCQDSVDNLDPNPTKCARSLVCTSAICSAPVERCGVQPSDSVMALILMAVWRGLPRR